MILIACSKSFVITIFQIIKEGVWEGLSLWFQQLISNKCQIYQVQSSIENLQQDIKEMLEGKGLK